MFEWKWCLHLGIVRYLQAVAQRYNLQLVPSPAMPPVAGQVRVASLGVYVSLRVMVLTRAIFPQVLEMLGGALRMAPEVVRRTIQEMDTRRKAIRDLRATLDTEDPANNTTQGSVAGAPSAETLVPASEPTTVAPPLRPAEGTKNVQDEASIKAREATERAERDAAVKAEAERKRIEDEARAKAEEEKKAAEKEAQIQAEVERERVEEEARAKAKESTRLAEQEAVLASSAAQGKVPLDASEKKELVEKKGEMSPGAPSLAFPSFSLFGFNLRGGTAKKSPDQGGDEESSLEVGKQGASSNEVTTTATPDSDKSKPTESTPPLRGGDASEQSSSDVARSSSSSPVESAGEWLEEIDPPTGKPYYWNTVTREVTWEKPNSD